MSSIKMRRQTKSDIMTQNPGNVNVWHKDGVFQGSFPKEDGSSILPGCTGVLDRSFTFSDERFG